MKDRGNIKEKNSLLVSCWADVNFALNASRFKFIGNGYIMSKQAISWHFSSHHSGEYGSGMNTNSHLDEIFISKLISELKI